MRDGAQVWPEWTPTVNLSGEHRELNWVELGSWMIVKFLHNYCQGIWAGR